ncbi:TPR-like protein [Pleurotus eryngii]|uniref:TPR-like protein n=1 Tax=Pleurotus eryngii TaxID=5323 RepID=A0A9P6D8J0_PLEER|nr:TPR-like protein [Pleurotus eryngii]
MLLVRPSMKFYCGLASGFTTHSDIGPAQEGPSTEVIAETQAQCGEEQEIYDQVDAAMDAHSKAHRQARELEELAKYHAEQPKIQQQFSDLKREVGNLTRHECGQDERSFAVPNSVLVGDRAKGEYENSLDPMQQEVNSLTNFVEIGQARDKIFSLKLNQVSGTSMASGLSNSINTRGYLTSIDSASVMLKTSAEFGDIKRARMLFDSLLHLQQSNPKRAPGWIAAACLEEHTGQKVAARKTIMQGCEMCPKSEDIWLEAAGLDNNNDAKVVLANAVQHVTAADLESDAQSKKRVVRKALEHIPNSVLLWKQTVNLETSVVDTRILLSRAVEVIPVSVDLWLALARLETPEKAKAVLNRASKSIPTKPLSLEQRAKELETVDKTIEAGVRGLRRHQVLLTREQWLKEAEKCESGGSRRACEAIVKACIGMGLEDSEGDRNAMGEEEKLDVWLGDAEAVESRGKMGTARAVLPWLRAAELEKAHGTRESLETILERAVHHCPHVEVLWLMAAKEKWLAFGANPESEQIWLAAVKLEAENSEPGAARELLTRARSVADTERIWMKSAAFERQQGQLDLALETLKTPLAKFPKFAKFYMIQGQIHESCGNIPQARASYAAGLKVCPKVIPLWILASRLEEKDGKSIKARCLLEKARLVNPANDELWAEAVHVEERAAITSSTTQAQAQAKAMLARGLQECPTSGARPMRKSRSIDALKKSADDPIIVCTVARLFWSERKIEKARTWFGSRGVWWLKFERMHGTEHREEVRKRCSIARDPQNTGKSIRDLLEMVADALN